MSKHVLSLLVEDKPGLLTRVAGLFARRGFSTGAVAITVQFLAFFGFIFVVVHCLADFALPFLHWRAALGGEVFKLVFLVAALALVHHGDSAWAVCFGGLEVVGPHGIQGHEASEKIG